MAELGLPGVLQPGVGLRGRVAGARGRSPFAAGPGNKSALSGGSEGRRSRSAFGGGRSLALLGTLAAAFFVASAHAQVLASRIWPARDYTRLTLESPAELKYKVFSIKDPERLVLDLEVAELSPALPELNSQVAVDAPYVPRRRVARHRPAPIR